MSKTKTRNFSVTKEVVKQFADFLKKNVRILKDVKEDWPSASQKLRYPSATIFTNIPEYEPLFPYPLVPFDPNIVLTKPEIKVKYVVGQYDWSLQLDLWTGNKFNRHDLYEEVFQAFHKQIRKIGNFNSRVPQTGLILTLDDYFKIPCIYTWAGYNFEDSEISSQRREWRVKIDILANTKAIVETDDFAILNTELQTDVSTKVVV